jgi:FAD-linked sulfhydryl oxidase
MSALFAMGKKTNKRAAPIAAPSSDCPPDVAALGRSSWTLLHSIAATYPEQPPPALQTETSAFLRTFSKLYPCWVCAEDFQDWMSKNTPKVSNRSEFGQWMCEAHNAVNVKLGKKEFDCNKWEERWRTGWKDGRCDP